MSEPTNAEKCRVVAERWLGWKLCPEHQRLGTHGFPPGTQDSGEFCRWFPDIPNDPVAASALRIALEKAGYSIVMRLVLNRWHIKLMGGEFRHDHLWPNVTASNEKLETALLEAAYQAELAEKGDWHGND